MGMLTVSCPSCGFSRQLPAEKVPEGPRRVTCPHCKEIFIYDKPVSPAENGDAFLPGSSGGSALDPPFAQASSPEVPSVLPDDILSSADDSPAMSSEEAPGCPIAVAMTDIGDLFRQSWELYKKRFATLVLLYLLTILAIVIPAVLAAGLAFFLTLSSAGNAIVVAVILAVLVGVAGSLWCYSGFLCAVVDDSLGLEDAMRRGKQLILPLAWIFLLTCFIITGGYLLLIIPGFIFTVWFFLAQFIMPVENVRGMEALLKSREYVRGHWLDVALRLFLVWVVSGVLGMVPILGPILALLFFPYLMIVHCLIYRDLRAIKGDISRLYETKDKLVWPGVALVGWIVVPAILVLLSGSRSNGKPHQGTQVRLETTRGGHGLPGAVSILSSVAAKNEG